MDALSSYLEELARELEAGEELTVVIGWGDELPEMVVRNDLSVEVERRSALAPIPYSLVKKPARRRAAAISAGRSGSSL